MLKDSNQIDIDGVSFIPVKRAAALADYTADYVGQLCRGGKLEATRIGRAWYVSEASIIAHRESQIVNEEEVKEFDVKMELRRIKESRIRPRSIFRDSSFVVYSRDERPLIPTLLRATESVVPLPQMNTKEEAEVAVEDNTKGEVAENRIVQKTPKSSLSYILRSLFATTSFAIVFLLLFSINSTYTGKLIGKGINSVVASVADSEVVGTVNEDILDPYRLSALKFSEMIDANLYLIVYGESIYDDSLKR